MLLNSQSSQFVFQFPTDFIPVDMNNRYKKFLEKNWIPYENVVDYLNSTIKGVDFGGLSIDTPMRTEYKSKERNYRPSKNFYDIISTRELNIEFRRADSDINYWLLHEIFKYYYTADVAFVNPFYLSVLDFNRDEIYKIVFREIILKSISEITFSYSDMGVEQKTFTLNINFNWYDVEFMLDPNNRLVVDPDTGETLIQNTYKNGN
jgi:hypothetical protein